MHLSSGLHSQDVRRVSLAHGNLFIHSFKCRLSADYVPGPVPGTRDVALSKVDPDMLLGESTRKAYCRWNMVSGTDKGFEEKQSRVKE